MANLLNLRIAPLSGLSVPSFVGVAEAATRPASDNPIDALICVAAPQQASQHD
jgi:hypothetical protein